jgi:FkbM family methyltransferase
MLWRKIRGRDMIEIGVGEIARYLPSDPVILEAGACDGTDTVRFTQRWPGGVIYAFEPVPELYAEAQRRTAHLPGVRLYPLALSSRPGPAVLHTVDPGPGGNRGTSSLLVSAQTSPDSPDVAYARDIEVQALTIADWAQSEGVDRIDFMWLDMEGMELPAMKAAGPVLATVRAVCMEVCREEDRVGTPLYGEIVAWMKDQGFLAAIDRVTLWFGNILFVRPDIS